MEILCDQNLHGRGGIFRNFQREFAKGMKVGDGEGDGAWRGEASDSARGSTRLMAERVRGQDTN